jgi:hypothetical protein
MPSSTFFSAIDRTVVSPVVNSSRASSSTPAAAPK